MQALCSSIGLWINSVKWSFKSATKLAFSDLFFLHEVKVSAGAGEGEGAGAGAGACSGSRKPFRPTIFVSVIPVYAYKDFLQN